MPALCFVIFLLLVRSSTSQQTHNKKKALTVISTGKAYIDNLRKFPGNKMLDVKKLIPSLILDLRYSSANNFYKKKIYSFATTTYLCKRAALALAAAQKKLQAKGYGLKIWDAYRPYSATVTIWKNVHDSRYAASPVTGSVHIRGIAADLTLVVLATNEELDMGTGFDNFTDSAHHDFQQLPEKIRENRRLLRTTMEDAGFTALETEWWHYSFGNPGGYPVLDLGFDQLGKLSGNE